jgi:prophage antirepressor-like protein
MKSTELMVTFEKHDLKLVEVDGERYLTTRALALSLDTRVRSLKKLVQEMRARGELKEGVHLKCLPVQTCGGLQTTILITYRGVIRLAMRSDSPRAVRFRDWAEEVLYTVMTRGGDAAQAIRSLIEKGLKEIGSANDQAAKRACDLILSLRSGEPTSLSAYQRQDGKAQDFITAMHWVRKYYPRFFYPSMNYGGKFEGYVAKRYLARHHRWPEHDDTTRLHAWVYAEIHDREFLMLSLVQFLSDELSRAIHQGDGGVPKAITAGEVE